MLARTGASFTAVTVKVTVAVSESSPSDTVNVKLSDPLKLEPGVYTTVAPDSSTVPFAGSEIL